MTLKNVPFQTVPAILFYNGIINISAQGKLLQKQSKLLDFNWKITNFLKKCTDERFQLKG